MSKDSMFVISLVVLTIIFTSVIGGACIWTMSKHQEKIVWVEEQILQLQETSNPLVLEYVKKEMLNAKER